MRVTLAFVVFLWLSLSAFAAEPQPPAPSSDRPQAQELTPQALGEMLRTAMTFHELVTKLDLSRIARSGSTRIGARRPVSPPLATHGGG